MLMAEADRAKACELLGQMETIARREVSNAEDTIPLVESDSRLGWEPSMEYVTDKWDLEWKIKQVNDVLATEIPVYRKMLSLSVEAISETHCQRQATP